MHLESLGSHWQDWLLFIGLLLLAVSFAMVQIQASRITACAAFGLITLHFLLGAPIQWAGVLGSLVFVAILAAQILRSAKNRKRTKLTAQEKALRSWLFPSMGDADFQALLKVSNRSIAPAGTFLVNQGEQLEQLHVIIQGAAHVIHNGMVVATLRDGSLVGEVSFFRDDMATASVVAQTDLNLLSISRTELRRLMKDSGDVKQALHESIGRDLGFKLTAFDQDQSRF